MTRFSRRPRAKAHRDVALKGIADAEDLLVKPIDGVFELESFAVAEFVSGAQAKGTAGAEISHEIADGKIAEIIRLAIEMHVTRTPFYVHRAGAAIRREGDAVVVFPAEKIDKRRAVPRPQNEHRKVRLRGGASGGR